VADFQLASLRPCLWRTRQPSLTACSSAHQVHSCRPGIKGPLWLCTVVPWPVHLCFRPSKSQRTSLFLQRMPHSASSSPLHCWQPSIFICWPSGVELLATGDYVGTMSGDLPHSTQRHFCSLNHPDIFWSDILCLHTVYSGPSSVLNTSAILKIHAKFTLDWSMSCTGFGYTRSCMTPQRL